MYQPLFLNLMKFLMAFSDTLDLVSPALAQHQLRTAFIAWKVGEALGLEPAAMESMVIAALMHDIGALTPEDKLHVHEADFSENTEDHCILGERVVRNTPLFENAAPIIRYHHTPWQVWALQHETTLAMQSQIVFLADTVERAIERDVYILHQDEAIVARIAAGVVSEFHPQIVEAFRAVTAREEFWLDLVSAKLHELFMQAPGGDRSLLYSAFLPISEMIRGIIDFRSHFTATHSTGVSTSAAHLAGIVGFSGADIEMMRIVGNLHDIGKMAVPNSILEKPGKLTREEFAIMRQHTYHTYSFLVRCGFHSRVAEWAGFHHERLDGSGYPFHLGATEISVGSRIVAVADILTALAEDRPYRKGMKMDEVLSLLRSMSAAGKIDGNIVDILARHYDAVVEPTLEAQHVVHEQYENNYLNHQAERLPV